MNRLLLLLLACLIINFLYGQKNPDRVYDGVYVGYEEMCTISKKGKKVCYTNPAETKRKWFRLSKLNIVGDSAFLDQNPISIYKKDTQYSASDGGFYYFTGKLTRKDFAVSIELNFTKCDYCAMPISTDPKESSFPWKKSYSCSITDQGLLLNGIHFTKITEPERLTSEWTDRTK
jgi:hypothetical protein